MPADNVSITVTLKRRRSPTMKNQNIREALDWRYATKKFDSAKTISQEDWETLEAALAKAPSSYGLQPYKFLVVETPALRAQLREVSWGQSQVTDAAKYVVLLTRDHVNENDVQKYVDRIAKVRSLPVESLKGYQDMMNGAIKTMDAVRSLAWSQRQAYIAMGFLLQTAALLKIDATPMEGLDPSAYDRILKLEGTGYKTVASVALGYRHSEDATQNYKKVRRATEDIIERR